MQNLSTELYKFIKEDEKANPFSDAFDGEALFGEMQISELHDSPLFYFLIYCNRINTDIKQHVVKAFKEINISKDFFLNALFRKANELFKSVVTETENALSKEASADIERSTFIKTNKDGNEIDIQFLAEVGPDITAEILRWIAEFETTEIQFASVQDIPAENVEPLLEKLWMYANIIKNVRDSAYGTLIFENGSVSINEEGNFKITSGLKSVSLINTCGEIRHQNHLTESQYYLQHLVTESTPYTLICKEADQLIIFEIVNDDRQTRREMGTSALLVYHFFSMNTALDYFDKLTLKELNTILFLIDEAISKLMHSGKRENENIPVKISRQNLFEIISQITQKEKETVDRILSSLCSKIESPYFWRGGLYPFEDHLYCPLMALTAANYNLYYEKWLDLAGMSHEAKEKSFVTAIIAEINFLPHKYQFELINFTELGLKDEFFINNILIKTRDHYILLQIVLYSFPIESNEIDESMIIIGKAVEDLRNKKNLIQSKEQKKVIALIVTNYTHFSGLVINDMPVADYTLFNNYFDTGKYSRAKMTFHNDTYLSSSPAEFDYYTNEDEFNEQIELFFNRPIPVHKILEKLYHKEITITPPFLAKQILIDKVEFEPEDVTLDGDIAFLSSLLLAKYIGNETAEDSRTDDAINFQLHTIFNKLSHSSSELLAYRSNIYRAISRAKEVGFFYLSVYIINTLPELKISIKNNPAIQIEEIDDAAIPGIFKKIGPAISGKRRISDFIIGDALNASEKKQVIAFAFVIVSHFSIGTFKDEDYDNYLFALTLLCGLRKDFDNDEIIFTGLSNLTDYLNLSNRPQDARDICEEVLVLYSKDHKNSHAWSIMLKCYSVQQNHFDAAIYGCLLFNSLTALPEIPYYLAITSLHSALIFFRNFHYHQFVANIYESVKTFPLREYDEQKFAHSYFNSKLTNAKVTSSEISDEIVNYLDEKLEKIQSFGEHGTVPWLTIIYNLIRLKNVYGYTVNEKIYKYKQELEKNIDKAKKEHFETIILGESRNLKSIFIKGLANIYRSRNVQDFTAEINNLSVTAQHLLKHSISTEDLDGILLCGQFLNDQTFTFETKSVEPGELREFSHEPSDEEKKRWKDYDIKMLEKLRIDKGQLLIWIFELYRDVYYLSINDSKVWSVKQLKQWDRKKMKDWVNNLGKFFFNSAKNRNYDIEIQEKDYKMVLKDLDFSEISIEADFSELLIISSIQISVYPHNLYQYKNDFIGAQVPVCNVLSFERYLSASNNISIPQPFSSSAWIPIEDGESTISWGYEKLLPVLSGINSKVFISRYPTETIKTDINIFLAHGETGKFGFRIINTNKEIGGTLTHPASVLGTGVVAILFICNTGNVSDNFYANNVISFATDLLKTNYQAVIAPFWKLDVTICSIWLDDFISSMKIGYTINESVYLANKEVSKYQESVSGSFYAVEGQLAMHLYGNPNIKFSMRDGI